MSGNRMLLCMLVCAALFACNKSLIPINYQAGYYKVIDSLPVDSSLIFLIRPYKDSLDQAMNEVIATSSISMPKGKPESLLGNLIADLTLEKAAEYYEGPVDFSVINYGGLRIPELPAGEITKGKVFELMPFDNYLVIMELNGEAVKKLVDQIALNGGWPVSGISFEIEQEFAKEIKINHQPLQNDKSYNVAISDYLADGGDNLYFLKEEKRKNLGIFLRDIIIEYFEEKSREGLKLSSGMNHRIIIK